MFTLIKNTGAEEALGNQVNERAGPVIAFNCLSRHPDVCLMGPSI